MRWFWLLVLGIVYLATPISSYGQGAIPNCLELHDSPPGEKRIKVGGEEIYIKIVTGDDDRTVMKVLSKGALGESNQASAQFSGDLGAEIVGLSSGEPLARPEFRILGARNFVLVTVPKRRDMGMFGIFDIKTHAIECGVPPNNSETELVLELMNLGITIRNKSEIVRVSEEKFLEQLGL